MKTNATISERTSALQTLALFKHKEFSRLDFQPDENSPERTIIYFYRQCNYKIGILVAYFNSLDRFGLPEMNYKLRRFNLLVGKFTNILEAFEAHINLRSEKFAKFRLLNFRTTKPGHLYMFENLRDEKETDLKKIDMKYCSLCEMLANKTHRRPTRSYVTRKY